MKYKLVFPGLLLFSIFGHSLFAQLNDPETEAFILQKDGRFWKDYNTCTTANLSDYLSEDLEFYHDKSGITSGLSGLLGSFTNGLFAKTTVSASEERQLKVV